MKFGALPFTLVGIIFLTWGLSRAFSGFQSNFWPTVPAKIDVSKVDSSQRRHGRTSYHANVTFTYEVNGQTYKSDKVSFGDYGSEKSTHARAIVKKYKPGMNVLTHYSPNSPDIAVLEVGSHWSNLILIGGGCLFAGLGSLIFLRVISINTAEQGAAANP